MPSVELTPETYEALKKLAAARGCTPDAVAQGVLDAHVPGTDTVIGLEDPGWADRLDEIRRKRADELTAEDIAFEAEYEQSWVNAKEWANALSPEELRRELNKVIAEVRAKVPAGLSEEEIEADIESAVQAARAGRLARGH